MTTQRAGDATTGAVEPVLDSDVARRLTSLQTRSHKRQRTASEAGPRTAEETMRKCVATLDAKVQTPEERADAERRQQERLANERKAQIHAAWRQVVSVIGRRYAKVTLASYKATHAGQKIVVDQVCRYAERLAENVKEGRGLVLYGPPGTGKDHLAVAVLRRAVSLGMKCEAVDGQMLFQKARDAIGESIREDDLLRPYLKADVLLISDPVPPLAAAKDYQLTVLWRLIDGRYRAMRPTFVTANVDDRQEFESRLSPNIVDRLIDGSLALGCRWPSYRKRLEDAL